LCAQKSFTVKLQLLDGKNIQLIIVYLVKKNL
jgi:hypothetical protein